MQVLLYTTEIVNKLRTPEYRDLVETARSKTNNAIQQGKLVRMPCEVCGLGKTQAHHDDYTKPLVVRWLCRPHHTIADKELRDCGKI